MTARFRFDPFTGNFYIDLVGVRLPGGTYDYGLITILASSLANYGDL